MSVLFSFLCNLNINLSVTTCTYTLTETEQPLHTNIANYQAIGLISRVFTNGSRDCGSIPGQFIPKTQKMVLDATLLNTQHYKLRIKGKVGQFREWSCTLPYTSV